MLAYSTLVNRSKNNYSVQSVLLQFLKRVSLCREFAVSVLASDPQILGIRTRELGIVAKTEDISLETH